MTRSLHVILIYILLQLALIFFLYPGDMIESTSVGHWVPILLGFGVYFFFLWLFMKGMSFSRGEDMVSLYMRMGKFTAVILLVPVFYYFVIECAVTIRAYAEIVTIVFLTNTPIWAIMLLLLLIPTFLAAFGLRTIFGTGVLVSSFGIPLALFICVSSFQSVDMRYVFPIFDGRFSFLMKTSYYRSFFVYTGSFIFLGFVQPYYKFRIRSVLITALCMLPMFLCAVYVPVLTFGEATAATLFLPFVVTLDVIHINWLMFERVAVFFLLSLISMLMLFLALVIWQSVRIASEFLPRIRSFYLLIIIVCVIFAISHSFSSWESVEQFSMWNIWPRFYMLIAVPITVYFLGRHTAGGYTK